MNKTIIGLLCGLSAASIWGGMYVVSKVVLEVIPPFTLLTIRLILGALTLGLLVLFRQRSTFTKIDFRISFLVGIVGYGISLGFQFIGTKLSTASNGALVTSATPAFVLLFAPFLLKEKTTIQRVSALIVSSLGVLAVIDPRTTDFSSTLFIGNLSLLAAALTWALYSVLVKKVSQTSDLLVSSMVMLTGGIPSSILFGSFELNARGLGEITPGIIAGILFLGVISTALAMFLWNYAFAELPAAVASLTFFAQPIVGTLLGWLFLGETITPLFILGGILIGTGLTISATAKS
jgi:drug/metabolite transporter (DMT)-like permease